MLKAFGSAALVGLIGYAGGRYVGPKVPLPANDWLGAALLAGVAGIVLSKVG